MESLANYLGRISHYVQLDAVMSLSNLCQLSVEDNLVSVLAPLSALRNLMELYIGNNQIDNLKVLGDSTGLAAALGL